MQDEVVYGLSVQGDAYFLGMFDGHGKDGGVIAHMARGVVDLATNLKYNDPEVADTRIAHVGTILSSVTNVLRDDVKIDSNFSGSTATVIAVHNDRFDIAWLGDSTPYFIPDIGKAQILIKPHNQNNAAEARRVKEAGGELRFIDNGKAWGYYWFDKDDEKSEWGLEPTRSIGDLALRFVSHDPDFRRFKPDRPGKLIVPSDGLLGGTVMSANLELAIRNGTINQQLIKELAYESGDNASVLIATIK